MERSIQAWYHAARSIPSLRGLRQFYTSDSSCEHGHVSHTTWRGIKKTDFVRRGGLGERINWATAFRNILLGGMARPLRLPGMAEQRVLDELKIQLLAKPAQQARWNRLVKKRHYLRSASLVGEQCRYAVSYRGKWVALQGGVRRLGTWDLGMSGSVGLRTNAAAACIFWLRTAGL